MEGESRLSFLLIIIIINLKLSLIVFKRPWREHQSTFESRLAKSARSSSRPLTSEQGLLIDVAIKSVSR